MIEFFFDCSSPWTYLAFRGIKSLSEETHVEISWRPILVGGIFNAVNKGMYAAREDMNSPKNRYVLKDLQDWSAAAGVQMVFPPKIFPVNSVKAMRGCIWIAQDPATHGKFASFVEAVFAAYFTHQQDISQDDVLADICTSVGINAGHFLAGIAQTGIKEALKANTDEAIRRGAFGSPTFFVGDDMYFGNDRLQLVRAAATKPKAAGKTAG